MTRLREVIAETAGREACTDEPPETLACLVEAADTARGRRYLSLGLLQAGHRRACSTAPLWILKPRCQAEVATLGARAAHNCLPLGRQPDT